MINYITNSDVPGMFRYLMEDTDEGGLGLGRQEAMDEMVRIHLDEFRRLNPDLDATKNFTAEEQLTALYNQEGYSAEQALSRFLNLPQHTSPLLGAEYLGRGVVENVIPAATSVGGARLALAATKLPFVPTRLKPLAAVGGFLAGSVAGAYADLKTGASEKANTAIFGEAEPLLPNQQITADGFNMAGGFLTFSGVMRNALKKIPGGIHPTEARGVLPWLKRKFQKGPVAPLGEVAAPMSGVNFGANILVNNVGKAPFRERALRFAERTAEAAGTRARFPSQYYKTEVPLAIAAGIGSSIAEAVDPGDPLTEFGFVSVSALTPVGFATRTGTGLASEFGKFAVSPIQSSRRLLNMLKGSGEAGAYVASKQVNAVYGPYLAKLEVPGRERLQEGVTALARLRDSGVSSEQLLPQLVAELTPKLTKGGVLAGEGAGFTPEQIQAAAENLIADRGYLPEIWSPDVRWDVQGTRQAEAAFIRSVLEADPNAHLLSPATTPGFENIDIILPQIAALSKGIKGVDGTLPAVLLERNTNQYIRNNFEALIDGLKNNVDPSLLQAFAEGQKEANYQGLAASLDDYLSRNTMALERVMAGADPKITPERMSEITLNSLNKWKNQARDVEKIGWGSLNLNGELMLPETLKKLDDLTISGILGGRLEPGDKALISVRDGLQLAGGVIGRPTSRLIRLRENARTKLANIRDTDEGLNFESAETLLKAIEGSIKAAGLQRIFSIDDAIPLLFRADDVGEIVNLAQSYQSITNQLPDGVLAPLTKNPKEEQAAFAARNLEHQNALMASLELPEKTSLSEVPKFLLANKGAFINAFAPSDKTSVQLTNLFRQGAPVGETQVGSIPETVGYGVALDLRSTMLARLREPNVEPSERRLLTELQGAVLADLKKAGLETGNEQLTMLSAYSEALNEIIIRSLAGKAADSVKNTDESLLMETLTRGSGTKVGQSIQSVINAGRFLEENTEEMLNLAAASDDPDVNAMVAYLEETIPENKEGLSNLQRSLESFLRNMVVSDVIKEVPIARQFPRDVAETLPDRVSGTEFFINPSKLDAFKRKFGNLSDVVPTLSTFFNDLENAASANNLIQGFKNNRGLVAERSQQSEELASLLEVENVFSLVDQNMGSDTPIRDLSNTLAQINRIKTSDVMIPSAVDGTMVPAKSLHEDAVDGFKYALWHWLLNAITDGKKEPTLAVGVDGKALMQEQPVLNAPKLFELWNNTPKMDLGGGTGRWTENQSLGQFLVNAEIYTPEQNAAIVSTLERMAEVQNRMKVFTDPNVLAMAAEAQGRGFANPFRDFVARVFGAAGGAAVAKGAASIPGVPMGASSLVAAGAGSQLARNVFNDMPRTFLAQFFSEIYEPGNMKMFAEFLEREPGPGLDGSEELRNFMLKHGLISSPFPFINLQEYLREDYVEPTGRGTIIPGIRAPIPPETAEELVRPTAQVQPPQPIAAPQPAAAPTSPAMRSQYAAAFPFDPASDLIRQQQARAPTQQGIGSLV